MAKKVNLDIAQTLNITCRRGDTFNLSVTLKDDNGPIALVDKAYEFIMQVRTSAFNDGVDGLVLTTAKGLPSGADNPKFIEKMGPSADENISNEGVVSIKIPDAIMRDIPSGRYVYDLQYVLPGATAQDSDTHTTILKGSFVVNEDVSEFAVAPTQQGG